MNMPKKIGVERDPIYVELKEIKTLLQELLIVVGARSGLTGEQVRKISGVQKIRVSEVWASIKKPE
jgi:hypothetical protein